ncbi:putative uncharacterized protein [Tetragenococcus halophilus subsp. halophilus]|uniref:DUF3290 domain-containing protein n=2 Tax=Tetragenococcus halophilus TaxID=51669 RepID=A0AAN1VRE0_TETHN|nr:DUF3290 family protein [Tetragenococcus halophilus]MDN6497906.1 DUF3290 family protein [Tetragenococcus koreensis]MDN6836021.1 DUF3290 family protein [Lactococcus lactis]AOF49050.1 hypothetical protein AC806_06440 [Tetragenococcus halophilus]AYW50652.1 DUF3290 domain-containing protein [Tetragenococcus halophilus]MCF1601799.1 DUF3290 family protein [Tetragenococcus halophilus]
MNALLGTLFLLGIIGTWYFVKKRPNKQYRNISLGIALVAAVLIWLVPSSYFYFVSDNNMTKQPVEKVIKNGLKNENLSQNFVGEN